MEPISPLTSVRTFLGGTRRLADVLPPEFLSGKYEASRSVSYAFVNVIATHRQEDHPWPGDHKHVSVWHVLANGKAVAWNQHPTRGWSFPVITYEMPLVAAASLPLGKADTGERNSQMADTAESLTAVLEGTGLRSTYHDDSGAWAIEGFTLTMLRRKAVKTALIALIAQAREHKLCVFFPSANPVDSEHRSQTEQRMQAGLLTLGFQVIDDPTLGKVIGIDGRERMTVRVNPIQAEFHQLLIESGFSFEVSSNMVIGLEYKHPSKPISVLLKDVGDGELEYVCLRPDGLAYEEQDYTEAEANWINEAPDEVERLRRELKARFDRF